jgi:predicted enzyme related to lactoylglutathione lyase
MSTVEKHIPGSFCWVELGTTNAKGAKAFYGGLFGWHPNDMPLGPDQFYTMLQVDGKEIGALYELDESMRRIGIPPHWLEYIAVASADDAAARVKALGGTVNKEPFDVFDAGRMAIIQDPAGAVFAIWQANRHIGARITGEPSTLCWSELITKDTAKSVEFYTKLFGWSVKSGLGSPREYLEIWNGDRAIGGMVQEAAELGDIPSHWMPYFLVTGCDSSAGKSKELGGLVQVRPSDIPGVGRFAVIADPQGAVFSLFQPARVQ